jgi:beta-phosphoglucomutase-like phosphatase (HAD superfamily)
VASCAERIKVEANLNAIKVELGWFDVILTGVDVPNMKPAPDIYLAAAEKLTIAPKSCCVIEDSINGIRAAKSVGMRCVAVTQSFAATCIQMEWIRPKNC